MPIIRLTQATWEQRELDRVRSILSHRLDRVGIEQDTLARLLERYLKAEYTPAQLVWFRDQLVEEGVIEIDESATYAMASAAGVDVAAEPEQKKFRWFWQSGKKKKRKKRKKK